MSVAPSGAILEDGGVYVGIKTPVRIFQHQTGVFTNGDKHSLKAPGQDVSHEKNHPLLTEDGHLDARFRQIIASVAAEFEKNTPAGHSRFIHKLGAGGKGTLRVFNNLPVGLPPHDVLTPGPLVPSSFCCNNAISKDDDRYERGGTLPVLQPETPEELQKPLLDFFMKTGSVFHVRKMVECLGYYIMTGRKSRAHKAGPGLER